MEKQQSSLLPLMIIGGVLLVVIVGGVWFYQTSASKPNNQTANTNKTTNSQTTATPNTANASPGAMPPNFKGAAESSVVLEEFADFQCPACAGIHPTMNEISGIYGSRIKFIYRNFPLPIHNKAYDAAVAAEAAGMQGKFWDMQNLLFQNQKNWGNESDHRKVFEGYANTLGMDIEKFKTDIASADTKKRVDADLQRGRSLNVSQTPSVYINGRLIPYESVDVSSLKLIIDAELKNKQTANQAVKPESSAAQTDSNKTAGNSGK